MSVTTGGYFVERINNDLAFEQVLNRITRLPEMDPSLAFSEAVPGFLGDITQSAGPWPGRDPQRWAIDGKSDIGRAIGPDQRARIGGTTEKHIAAIPGIEVAGVSQKVGDKDYLYGGMTRDKAERKAILPLRSFNERVAKSLMDVATSGDYSGSVTNNFAWSTPDQDGATATSDQVAQSANQVADVYANDSQSILWPKRDGSETAAGHDHISDFGATWVRADAITARDSIQEHPNMGRVRGYASSTVAALVRAAAVSAYGAIAERVPLITGGDTRDGGFGYASPMNVMLDDIEWWYAPDLPADSAIYAAIGHKPFHAHIGTTGDGGRNLSRGYWTERGDAERGGTYFGYRSDVALGVKDPLSVFYGVHNA